MRDNGHEPKVIDYLKTPPTINELNKIVKTLGIAPGKVIRKGEKEYKGEKINKIVKDEDLIKAMIRYPKLIERPIVIKGNKGIIGRPPKNVLKLI